MRYRDLEIKIEYKRIKNVYLKLEDDFISVSAPYGTSLGFIYGFIDEKYNWIKKAYKKKENTFSLMYKGGDIFYVYGTAKRLKESADVEKLYKILNEDVLIKANRYVDKYLPFINSLGYYNRPILKMRKMKARWGDCFVSKNTITLNSHLIHYPLECLEYIVLHEMCHFIEPNHSKRFYELIEKNLHNYKEITKKLV